MEKERADCFDLEERLAALARTALRGDLAGEVYRGVEDYDPVLRSHCRLDENGESSTPGRLPR